MQNTIEFALKMIAECKASQAPALNLDQYHFTEENLPAEALAELRHLKSLSLNFDSCCPNLAWLRPLLQLERLTLRRLDDRAVYGPANIDYLANLTGLKYLRLTGHLGGGIGFLRNLKQLKFLHLDLGKHSSYPKDLEMIGDLACLEELYLEIDEWSLSHEINVQALTRLPRLKVLTLNFHIPDFGFLSDIHSLESLVIPPDSIAYEKYLFNQVCQDLGLEDTPDWGIINSNGSRVKEFIAYTYQNEGMPFSIHYSFLDLIIASMNDSIVEKKCSKELKNEFYKYVLPKLGDKKYYPHVTYWISISSKDEFPVGYLLSQYVKINQMYPSNQPHLAPIPIP